MTPATTAFKLFTSRLNEERSGLDVLPKLAGLPFGKFYGGYLLFRLTRKVDSLAAELEQDINAKIYQTAPQEITEEWVSLYTAHIAESRKILVEAQKWAAKEILPRFAIGRFVRAVEKAVALMETALSQISSRMDAPYTYEELDDPEEQAFFQAFAPKTSAEG